MQEKSGSDIDGKAPVRIHATSIENLNSVLPTQAISSYFGQGDFSSTDVYMICSGYFCSISFCLLNEQMVKEEETVKK